MNRSTFPPLEDDFTRALLRSAESDEPSSAAYAKAAAALGVGAGLGVGVSLAAPPALAAGAAGVARWSLSNATRWWAFGVSGALLVGGGALLVSTRAPAGGGTVADAKLSAALHAPPAKALSAAPLASAASATTVTESDSLAAPLPASSVGNSAPVGTPVVALAPVAVQSSPGVEPRSSGSARRSAPLKPVSAFVSAFAQAASANVSGSSLAEQVQSLDRARVALGSGDAGSALREIAHYRKAWPQGVFLTEASVLEIEALAARGERSLAAARAAAFVSAHPDSPQAERLRRLIPEKP